MKWKYQRVFYATPQTLLNDLVRGNVNALDIVLIVIGTVVEALHLTFSMLTQLWL